MKVNAVQIKQGIGKDGRPWTRYDVTLEGGMEASGFDPVAIGEEVDLVQKGKYLNFVKPGSQVAINKPKFMGSESLFTKDDYWTRKEKRDLDQQPRIERQHSQQMALMYFTLIGGVPVEEAAGAKDRTYVLRTMIDWFQRDIGQSPYKVPPVPPPELPTELPTDPQDELSY